MTPADVVRERTKLRRLVAGADKKIADLERRITAERRRVSDARERLGAIDAAFLQLERALGGTLAVEPSRPRLTRKETAVDRILEAIGKQGLDDWRPADIIQATGLHPTTISPVLSELAAEGRIRRLAPGRYRTVKARVVA